MKRLFITVGICLVLSAISKAQVTPPSTSKEAAPLQLTEEQPLEGTYQIVLKKGSVQVQLSDQMLKQIEQNRHHDTETYLKVSDDVKVKILSYSTIKASDFKPVDLYSYEN
jgi:hypothetical protein